jgi:O-antigen/teichoic acid export membrane protein
MPGLMSRGFILTVSRVSNFAIIVLSPLFLVRILDVEEYGKYQEFMIYAMIFVTICAFGIDSSLTYFLPRYPDKEREFVSQNSALILISSSTCMAILILARQLFLEIATYDFVLPLAAYVFCFVNLNWLEYYWIAKRRTDLVLYYSAARLILRVSVLLVVAYITRDVEKILWSLVCVEALRMVLVGVFLLRAKLLVISMDYTRTKEQVQFAGPIGLAALLLKLGRSIGKLFVASTLGPAALAYYAVASYLLPMVRVIRGSIGDVIFPEMVRVRHDPSRALRLWQRTNVVFCVLLFPPFVLLSYYADLVVTTLFTAEYLPAVPIFQIYILWLIRRCFNMDVLLRTRGKSGFMLIGTGMSVGINLGLMLLFYRWFGLIGPAIAFMAAEILLEVYYAVLVRRAFGLSIKQLADWGGVCRVGIGCLAGVPVLFIADQVPGPELVRAATASAAFIGVSWFVAFRLGVTDIGRLVRFALSRISRTQRAR